MLSAKGHDNTVRPTMLVLSLSGDDIPFCSLGMSDSNITHIIPYWNFWPFVAAELPLTAPFGSHRHLHLVLPAGDRCNRASDDETLD